MNPVRPILVLYIFLVNKKTDVFLCNFYKIMEV